MFLSETVQYRKWVSQFSESDRSIAKLLVDSIKYVDEETFIYGLYQNLISTTNSTDVYALFAVREKSNNPYFQNTEDKNVHPYSINPIGDIGSEGEVVHFIRDISRSQCNFLNHPSLMEMKEKKCRHIIFLDDFSGTGNQIIDFIDWFYENKTIKSWFSLGYIDFIIYTYAITDNALQKLTSIKKINQIHYETVIGKGSPLWTLQEYSNIENLCIKYGSLFKVPQKFLLGYKDSFSLIIFSHKCPNNVPGILWYSKSKKFVPLVNYRPNFDFTKMESFLYSFSEIINRLHYVFLKQKQIRTIINDNEKLFLILQFLNKRAFNEIRISKYFNISIREIHKNMSQLLKNDWIDSNNKITKEGKRVLKYFKKKERRKQHLEEKNDFYYPLKLRAPV